jgi:glycosyltransferase involved in cell wall biosynthesis
VSGECSDHADHLEKSLAVVLSRLESHFLQCDVGGKHPGAGPLKQMTETNFNVIIPTRERADTLRHSLRTVLRQDYERLQVIVSDNHSKDDTESVVRSFNDKRIRYVNTGRRLSMSHNWEFGLSHVRGAGWVTFLGDDDGFLPGSLRYADSVIRATGCDALGSRACQYVWPTATGDGQPVLIVPLSAGFERRKSARWLRRVLLGRSSYQELPWLYTGGFAPLEIVRRAVDGSGRFFRSRTPDLYSAVAISSVVNDFVFSHRPLVVNGCSQHSTGASFISSERHQLPADTYHSENNIPFHGSLGNGRVRSIPLLVYECYLQSSFLHHNKLRIEFDEQLAIALAVASAEAATFAQVRSYVSSLLGAPESISRVEQRAREIRRVWFLRRALSGFRNTLPEAHVPSAYGARDVFEATWVADSTYRNRVESRSLQPPSGSRLRKSVQATQKALVPLRPERVLGQIRLCIAARRTKKTST